MATAKARCISLASAIFILASCQVVGDYESFEAKGTVESPCAALPPAKNDSLGLSVMARVDITNSSCIWIDETEVTVEQYSRWQAAVALDDVIWEPTWCVWKTARSEPSSDPTDACVAALPAFEQQPFAPRKPIRCVDFCDAEAFCHWAGKRLCYDGTGLGFQGPRGVPKEWFDVCTNDLTTIFPWGDDAEAGRCNTRGAMEPCLSASATCGPLAVGQNNSCAAASGVRDLLGNVSEWVFSCNFVDENRPLEPTGCLTRGGGYDAPLQTCSAEKTIPSDTRLPSLGFRCCADLTAAEQVLVR